MKKSKKAEEAFVLIDAVVSLIVISIFIIAAASLFFGIVKNAVKAQTEVENYLEQKTSILEKSRIYFHGE